MQVYWNGSIVYIPVFVFETTKFWGLIRTRVNMYLENHPQMVINGNLRSDYALTDKQYNAQAVKDYDTAHKVLNTVFEDRVMGILVQDLIKH